MIMPSKIQSSTGVVSYPSGTGTKSNSNNSSKRTSPCLKTLRDEGNVAVKQHHQVSANKGPTVSLFSKSGLN